MGTVTICTHCGSTKSPLWRRGIHSEILCNACGLYWKHHGTYRPLEMVKALGSERKDSSSGSSSSSSKSSRTNDDSSQSTMRLKKRDSSSGSKLRRIKVGDLAGLKSISADSVLPRRKIAPIRIKSGNGKMAISSYFLQSVSGRFRGEAIFTPELPPSTGTANVQLVAAKVKNSSALDASLLHDEGDHENANFLPAKINKMTTLVKYIMFRGRLLFVGDYVAVKGDDAQVYFAIIHDFWMIANGRKFVRLQWLLPKGSCALQIDGPREQLDPSLFTLGPMHCKMEHIEAIIDVFFSPQRLQRPLEGPTVILPANNHYQKTSRTGSPTTTMLDDNFLSSEDGLTNSSGGILSRGEYTEGGSLRAFNNLDDESVLASRAHSDSEIELKRITFDNLVMTDNPKILKQSLQTMLTTTTTDKCFNNHTNSDNNSSNNILEDIEMAHLLCSMH